MKIHITRNSNGSKVFNDSGHEITGISGIEVNAHVNKASEAIIKLIAIETIAEPGVYSFNVAGHDNIVSLIDKDGNIINLVKGK